MSQLSQGAVREIVSRIGSDIAAGRLEQGIILPKEPDLAACYGVGRSTLREAVKVLSAKGMIRTVRRFGSQVCPSEDWNFLDPDVLGWFTDVPENVPGLVLSIIELRSSIEPVAAALAARRAKPEEAAEILRNAEALLATLPGTPFEVDVAFHLGVLKATHNVLFRGLANSYEILLRAQFKACWPVLWEDARYHPDEKHVHLARAIIARDATRATRIANDMMRAMRHNTMMMARKLGVQTGPIPRGPAPARLMLAVGGKAG